MASRPSERRIGIDRHRHRANSRQIHSVRRNRPVGLTRSQLCRPIDSLAQLSRLDNLTAVRSIATVLAKEPNRSNSADAIARLPIAAQEVARHGDTVSAFHHEPPYDGVAHYLSGIGANGSGSGEERRSQAARSFGRYVLGWECKTDRSPISSLSMMTSCTRGIWAGLPLRTILPHPISVPVRMPLRAPLQRAWR